MEPEEATAYGLPSGKVCAVAEAYPFEVCPCGCGTLDTRPAGYVFQIDELQAAHFSLRNVTEHDPCWYFAVPEKDTEAGFFGRFRPATPDEEAVWRLSNG